MSSTVPAPSVNVAICFEKQLVLSDQGSLSTLTGGAIDRWTLLSQSLSDQGSLSTPSLQKFRRNISVLRCASSWCKNEIFGLLIEINVFGRRERRDETNPTGRLEVLQHPPSATNLSTRRPRSGFRRISSAPTRSRTGRRGRHRAFAAAAGQCRRDSPLLQPFRASGAMGSAACLRRPPAAHDLTYPLNLTGSRGSPRIADGRRESHRFEGSIQTVSITTI